MIAKLHYITQDLPGHTHQDLTRLACKGGVSWVQLRMKNTEESHRPEIVKETFRICKEYGARLIINDYVFLAREFCTDGVHLGQTDIPVDEARKILGPSAIIGATANNWNDLKAMASTSANYIGLGPFRFTHTKKNLSPVLGSEGIESFIKQFRMISDLPVIAIGGIKVQDVEELIRAGVNGIAVSSAIGQDPQPEEAAKRFVLQLKQISETYIP
ncbi:MAG: thiamine phosphate synthase [Bacteroidia bacterium]